MRYEDQARDPGNIQDDGSQSLGLIDIDQVGLTAGEVSGLPGPGLVLCRDSCLPRFLPGRFRASNTMPTAPSPKDIYQQLKEEHIRIQDENRQARATIEDYDRKLKRITNELRQANQRIRDESQSSKDFIRDLQNLINSHQKLDTSKADTLSISDVGEKVTALNEELFQAAATLGEALIHKRYEVSQKEFEAAAALAQEMVGEKMTNVLIAQAQKQESEVNPLLVQVVLQIFMVNFCVSKIQSWYPDDAAIGEFLSTIYYEIRSTGKASHRF